MEWHGMLWISLESSSFGIKPSRISLMCSKPWWPPSHRIWSDKAPSMMPDIPRPCAAFPPLGGATWTKAPKGRSRITLPGAFCTYLMSLLQECVLKICSISKRCPGIDFKGKNPCERTQHNGGKSANWISPTLHNGATKMRTGYTENVCTCVHVLLFEHSNPVLSV